MSKSSRPHGDAVMDLLHETRPLPMNTFPPHWMKSTSPEAVNPCWPPCVISPKRKSMTAVAEHAGIPRESLYRALSTKGNPTIKTLLAVVAAAGLKLSVHR